MKVKQEFFGFNPIMWMGVVEDNNDPIKLGRLKVRIFGWHSGSPKDVDGEPGVKTEDLPWAQVMQPVNNGPNSGVGGPVTGIQQGTWVMGMFLDGEIAREPMVMGSIPGIPTQANPNAKYGPRRGIDPVEGFYDPDGIYPLKDRLEEPDTNRLARNDNVKVHGDKADYPHPRIESRKNSASEYTTASGYDFVEPAFDSWEKFKAKYPDNHVWETKAGHIFEIDDTPFFERIHIAHKNGSYVEMGGAAGPGGRIDKVAGDWMLLASDQMIMNSIGQLSITAQQTNIQSQTVALKTSGGVTITGSLKVTGGATFEGGGFKSGATDTFTAVGGRVVTVMNGIITSVTEA